MLDNILIFNNLSSWLSLSAELSTKADNNGKDTSKGQLIMHANIKI